MVGNNKGDSAELVRAPTHAADRVITAKQILRRYLADGENYLRLQQFDLPFEVFATGRSFVGLRVAVVRRPAFQNIGDEYTVSTLTDGEQHLIEQLPGAANEWFAAPVLFRAGCFADN
jgi:hypothetical protein